MNLPKNDQLIDFLRELFKTNNEFAKEHGDDFFAEFSNQQNPNLTIVTCSDSRVQFESFDKTPQNEVFAIRNIGNQISTSEGSVDFGVSILKTPFLFILGHSNCGAVNAVINNTQNLPSAIQKELSTLKLTTKSAQSGVIENVNNQVSYACAIYADLVVTNKLTVLGGIYDFKNDFGYGSGKIILINVNNVIDNQILSENYQDLVSNLALL